MNTVDRGLGRRRPVGPAAGLEPFAAHTRAAPADRTGDHRVKTERFDPTG